jgi:hypothetical protein
VKTEKQRTRKAPSKQAAVSACSGSEDEATPVLKASKKEKQSVNVVQSDKYKYGEGINTEGRPFPRVEDMLKHMTKKAIEAKFGDVARHLQRPLKVATFCSGTDCPILGLDLFISGRFNPFLWFISEYLTFLSTQITSIRRGGVGRFQL